jgi:hypothetical protein
MRDTHNRLMFHACHPVLQHVFCWMVAARIDLAALVAEAREKAVAEFQELPAEEKQVWASKEEEFLDLAINEHLDARLKDLIDEHLAEGDYGENGQFGSVLSPGKGDGELERLFGGLIECAIVQLDIQGLTDLVRIYVEYPAIAEAVLQL